MLHFSPLKTFCIWSIVFCGLLFSIPNLLPSSTLNRLPDFFPKNFMVPGLDLQGGSHILLEIDKKKFIQDRLNSVRDEIRSHLLNAKIGYKNLIISEPYVQIYIVQPNKLPLAKKLLSNLLNPLEMGFLGEGSGAEFFLQEPQEGVLRYTLTDSGINYRLNSALNQSIAVIGRRVNELGTTEPIIQKHGSDRILIQIPGVQDPQRLKNMIGQTAKLTFQMVDQLIPAGTIEQKIPQPLNKTIMRSRGNPNIAYSIENHVALSGENLVDAQPGFDQTGEPIVTFRLDTKGALSFGQISQKNVGRAFAIILDGEVISAPSIREPILGGTGQISGGFSVEEAKDLAVLLKAGALPADLKIVEERTVGPSLGADSIAAGKIASLIACVLVAGFMLFAYSTLGLIANIALLINIVLIVASLSLLGATLTMPGIAGIVLTMGMAVDSNVIIYERVREELVSGKILLHAFDSGFSRAMATIFDANFTTLIAAAILFLLGSGPVKGFAVTLAIGIVTTVFTTFTLSRWMVSFWIRYIRPKVFPMGVLSFIPTSTPRIPFMLWSRASFFFSAFLSVLTIVLFFTLKMNYGIDFQGGTLIEVQAKSGVADSRSVRENLNMLNIGDIQVQKFGSDKELLIRVENHNMSDQSEQTLVKKVRSVLEKDYEFRRVESVGPTVSSELAWYSTLGVLFSLLAIFIYIWCRFEWQFSLGAIIATLHDVLMVLGLYIVSGFEFNITSIAALLTIVGYSINDTVVVYDRIRENLRKYKKLSMNELIDLSINQTLSRTILTGLTTLLALFSLYIFGGEVIRSFTFAMIFGIVFGTYSSVFVAGPLLIFFKLRTDSYQPRKG